MKNPVLLSASSDADTLTIEVPDNYYIVLCTLWIQATENKNVTVKVGDEIIWVGYTLSSNQPIGGNWLPNGLATNNPEEWRGKNLTVTIEELPTIHKINVSYMLQPI